jgi:hypothetical protein
MFPCPITVYMQGGQVFISTVLFSVLAGLYPESDFAEVARLMEEHILEIIAEAR